MIKHSNLPFLLFITLSSLKTTHSNHQCEICIKTFKTNCQICYDSCQPNPQLISCTLLTPSQNISLSTSNCLNTCCPQNMKTAIFTQQLFNLCIQKDAFIQNNINKGLTLGLILGLTTILSIAGLGYQLGIIKQINILQQAINSENQRNITSPNQNHVPNQLNPINNQNPWKQYYKLQGICPICNNFGINLVLQCGHGYHYGCLANSFQQQKQNCLLCQNQESFTHAKIYCSNCKQSYRQFNSKNQKIDKKATETINNLKCPNCTHSPKKLKL